jgi:hypothetical protein
VSAPREDRPVHPRALSLLLLAGCASRAAPPPTLTPPAVDVLAAPCLAGCEARQARRAVAVAVIRADCERTCAGLVDLPRVTSATELARHRGARVRVSGRVDPERPGVLVLADGGEVEVVAGALAAGPHVEAAGTLEGGGLAVEVSAEARAR